MLVNLSTTIRERILSFLEKKNWTLRPWCQVTLSWITVNLSQSLRLPDSPVGHCTVCFKVAVLFSNLYFPNILCPNEISRFYCFLGQLLWNILITPGFIFAYSNKIFSRYFDFCINLCSLDIANHNPSLIYCKSSTQ